jgi:hypothetical protein
VLYRILFCIQNVLCYTVSCFLSRLYCGVPYLGLYPDCVVLYCILFCIQIVLCYTVSCFVSRLCWTVSWFVFRLRGCTILWKKSLNSDGHQFRQYQENEQSHLIVTKLTEHKKTYGVGNPGPVLGQAQQCGGVKHAKEIITLLCW